VQQFPEEFRELPRRRTLREKVGMSEPRSERPEWMDKLKVTIKVLEKARDAEEDLRVLRGSVPDLLGGERAPQNAIRFLVSSTFTDTEWERNLLLEDVTPYIEDYARRHGIDYYFVEMRFGIRDDAAQHHKTSEICMAELERCQSESLGFTYVFLGCDK
jgi:hypothetical protein